MAVPAVQTRSTLASIALQHNTTGFGACRFVFGLLPGFKILEAEITPGDVEGGPPIPQSTFYNILHHTQLPQTLLLGGPFKVRGLYDNAVWGTSQIKAIGNKNQACTFLLPNTDTLSFFGWPRKFTFTTFKIGAEAPMIEVDIEQSSFDPVNRCEAGWSHVDNSSGTSDS